MAMRIILICRHIILSVIWDLGCWQKKLMKMEFVWRLSGKKPDMVYVMPSHQFPLGNVMPLRRRLELLQWASEGEERYIIEDDHDSEFRYKGKADSGFVGK